MDKKIETAPSKGEIRENLSTPTLSSSEEGVFLCLKNANKEGLRSGDQYWSYHTPILQLAYNLGKKGMDLSALHIVTGYRYGGVHWSGLSHNYASDTSEGGLSMAKIDGEKECGSVIWFADRDKVQARGILLPYRGSDGEALIIPLNVEIFD